MAIGSFVNGVFKGMDMRESRDDRKTERTRNETRWENEEADMGRNDRRWEMEQERHAEAMRRSARVGRGGSGGSSSGSRAGDIRNVMAGYDGGGSGQPAAQPQTANTGGLSILNAATGGAPLGYGSQVPAAPVGAPAAPAAPAAQPIEMSALPASQQAAQPVRYSYVQGQGLIPRGAA